jgi:hypothetical protein
MAYFNFPNKEVIIHRCNGKTTSLYKKQYFFKYSNNSEYNFLTVSGTYNRSRKCKASNVDGTDEHEFECMRDALKYFGIGSDVKVSRIKPNETRIFSSKKYNKKIKITII